MSRTTHSRRPRNARTRDTVFGREYGGKRAPGDLLLRTPGAFTKAVTHRKERIAASSVVAAGLAELSEYREPAQPRPKLRAWHSHGRYKSIQPLEAP